MLATQIPSRIRRMIVALTVVALTVGACQAAASPTPTANPNPTANPTPAANPTPTANPTATHTDAGTITLTETGCSWAGNPGSMRPGRVMLTGQNSTDDYGLFIVHRLHAGKSWADGEALIAAIQEALRTDADWPPEVSEAITEMAAKAGDTTRLAIDLSAGTYGVVCSANTSSVGDILTVYLVGPLSVAP